MTRPDATPDPPGDRRWVPEPEMVVQRLGTVRVLVDLRTLRILELDEAEVALFELLADAPTEDEAVALLARRGRLEPARLRPRVAAMLRRLREARAVRRAER